MSFPDNFVWGCAAASYQIEGSTQDAKLSGESVWDMCCKKEGFVKGGDTGYVACDHYNRYQTDVEIMKSLSLQAYRLSIMWPRVLPEGTGKVNAAGMDFYERLVDSLLEAGIDPWVTLFHWDYPVALFNKGGWLNSDSSDWFADYVKLVVEKLSDRVTHWFTLNEPACFIGLGHQTGNHAPGLQLADREVNRAWHNALLAHGKAVKTIREFSKKPARIGAAPCFLTSVPATESQRDIEAARQYLFKIRDNSMFNASWWLEPVLSGKYPEDGLALFGENGPPIREGDMDIISQEIDFIGCNIYHSVTVKEDESGQPEVVSYPNDYPRTHFNWPVTPEALRWSSKFLYERYNKPIVITENGLSVNDWVAVDGEVHDPQRIDFLTRYISGVKEAIKQGVDIRGYFQWSIMDNFEWAEGFSQRFGLVHVDYNSQKRTIKDSGFWYKNLIESKGSILEATNPLQHWPSDAGA